MVALHVKLVLIAACMHRCVWTVISCCRTDNPLITLMAKVSIHTRIAFATAYLQFYVRLYTSKLVLYIVRVSWCMRVSTYTVPIV